ncbi:hypothetical protein EP7_005280 [Isosphaeraceae bacterium EP7]
MAPEMELRLAWWFDMAGRRGTRDVLLTIALASSRPGDPWAELCWRLLVSSRPDHWLAECPSLAWALGSPKILTRMAHLRQSFPPARIEHMLMKAEALAGPWRGRRPEISLLLADLLTARPQVTIRPKPRPKMEKTRRPAEPDRRIGRQPLTMRRATMAQRAPTEVF